MPMYKLQAHIDQKSDISRLYATFSSVAVYTHYTAVSCTWWAQSKEKAERYMMDFLEKHSIDWSGIFVKELVRGSV